MNVFDNLKVDPARDISGQEENFGAGIYIRAKRNDEWDSVDIVELDYESLAAFLKEKGLEWTIGVVQILLCSKPK